MKVTLLLLCTLAITSMASAQKAETELRDVDEFTSLQVSSIYNVDVRQGDTYSVELEAAPELLGRAVTEVRRGVLTLKLDDGGRSKFGKNDEIRAVVTLPVLEAVGISGAADVRSEVTWEADGFAIDASGASDLTLVLEVGSLAINGSGASDIMLSGTATTVAITSSGDCDVEAGNLTAQDVTASSSGASDIVIRCERSMTADASGASDIEYSGSVTRVQANASGAADIDRIGSK